MLNKIKYHLGNRLGFLDLFRSWTWWISAQIFHQLVLQFQALSQNFLDDRISATEHIFIQANFRGVDDEIHQNFQFFGVECVGEVLDIFLVGLGGLHYDLVESVDLAR